MQNWPHLPAQLGPCLGDQWESKGSKPDTNRNMEKEGMGNARKLHAAVDSPMAKTLSILSQTFWFFTAARVALSSCCTCSSRPNRKNDRTVRVRINPSDGVYEDGKIKNYVTGLRRMFTQT